jgi:hypothetical protein
MDLSVAPESALMAHPKVKKSYFVMLDSKRKWVENPSFYSLDE